jgi:uncharacterized protein DUF1565
MKVRTLLLSVAALASLVLGQSPAVAATLYVATTGIDSSNNCQAQNQPCATITYASSLAQPGDTVSVAPGTYNTAVSPFCQTVNTAASGTPNAYITYVSQERWGAVISQSPTCAAWANYGSYVIIDGFEVIGNPSSSGIVGIYTAGQFTTIQHNKVHGIQPSLCTGLGMAGIDADATNVNVLYNFVYGNGPSGCSFGQGIYLTHPSDIAADNISYLNSGHGIQAWGDISNELIVNNTTFNNGFGGVVVGSDVTGVTIDHNIVDNNIVDGGEDGIGFEWGGSATMGSNNAIDNNLCFQNSNQCLNLQPACPTCTVGATNNDLPNTDPQFINYQPDGSGNYRLQANSPAIGFGLVSDQTPHNAFQASFPTLDFDGNPRPARPGKKGFDLGAFESACPCFVQVQNNIDPSGIAYTSFSVPITTSRGDLLVAFVRESSNGTDNFTVTDSAGQTWTQTSSGYNNESDTGPRIGMFYVANSAAVTSVTVNYTTPGGVIKPGIVVMEISGAANSGVADGSVNQASLSSVQTSTSGSLTTTNANDILIFATDTAGNEGRWVARAGQTAAAGDDEADDNDCDGDDVCQAGPVYTIPNNRVAPGTNGSNVRMAMSYAVVSSTETNTVASTKYADGNWNGNIFAAFK